MNSSDNKLTESELTSIKQVLESKRSHLRSFREMRLAQIKDGSDSLKDAADVAGHEGDLERMWFFLNRDQSTENKINDALKRIESGAFGLCRDCDSPISFKRLQIDPTSELCINCKNEIELEESGSKIYH
ncbi:MAG: TraR/DksA family transcriptional regulator [Oligoflexia bacterium]|nr:TraR/DksA family transcriptional regulator [Oligoflexia bacterium]